MARQILSEQGYDVSSKRRIAIGDGDQQAHSVLGWTPCFFTLPPLEIM
jgi:hypothetical protein